MIENMPAETSTTAITSGWVDRSSRARLEIGGPDRAKFLHNLTTNDVKRLSVGQGQESFVTTLQGKTLAYLTIVATEIDLHLRTERASLEGLMPHLQKYGVFDDVVICDVSDHTFEIHAFGPKAFQFLRDQEIELSNDRELCQVMGKIDSHFAVILKESPTGLPGFSVVGGLEGAQAAKARLDAAGLTEVDIPTFDALRIEAGTPISGRDVTLANLPQEIGRDSKTINFVKGCYLGQETVARLDALGHVNRILKGLTLEGSTTVPPDGTPLTFDGKPAGAITSAAFSASRGCPVALGYLKVAQAVAGTKLTLQIDGIGEFEATVRDLPMPSPG